MTFSPVDVGDIVRLRKQHACGGCEWDVVRTGADIGLVCRTCGRRLLLPRDQFRRGLKSFVHKVTPEVTKDADPQSETPPESENN